MEDLLPSDISQPPIKLLDLGDNAVDLPLVLTLDLARLANGQIYRQLDTSARDAGIGEPSSYADCSTPAGREA